MSKREESKYKINRRLGVNLWGRAKSPLNRREYGPGQHGQRRKKPSDYGTQLSAKQKLKGYYANIGERQFRRLYEEAVRRRGDTGENLIELLERRLDATVYRMKLAPTPFAARQLVNHGHVLVNGRRVNIPSYQLRDGDTIELRQQGQGDGAGARSGAIERARRARLHRDRPRPHARPFRARAEAGRRALSGDDGAEPRRRILFALTCLPTLSREAGEGRLGAAGGGRVGVSSRGRPHPPRGVPGAWPRAPLLRCGRRRAGAAMLTLHLSIVLLLILLNGFFAMAEIALVSARPARLQPLAAQGSARRRGRARIEGDPSRLLATVQIGITIIAVLSGTLRRGDARRGVCRTI